MRERARKERDAVAQMGIKAAELGTKMAAAVGPLAVLEITLRPRLPNSFFFSIPTSGGGPAFSIVNIALTDEEASRYAIFIALLGQWWKLPILISSGGILPRVDNVFVLARRIHRFPFIGPL